MEEEEETQPSKQILSSHECMEEQVVEVKIRRVVTLHLQERSRSAGSSGID